MGHPIIKSESMKLTLAIATCLVLYLLLLLSCSNVFDISHPTTTRCKNEDRSSCKPSDEESSDKLLGGLLVKGFDDESCLSRYDQSMGKPSPYKPSDDLVSKLRSYEMLHKRCGQGTESYKKATEQLGQNHHVRSSDDECRYVVWTWEPSFGLGNRILSLVSVFLYALLTERVMLVDQRSDITDLFCEPFLETSWLLPQDSPLTDQLDSFNWDHPRCYGTLLKNHAINSTTIPTYLYLEVIHRARCQDKMFFCEEDQAFLNKVPWLVLKSNLYFVPSLWMIHSFETDLMKLFPQKETIFHHLSRYLLHPTNQVWGMVTRSYNSYLSKADTRLGLQVRVFSKPGGYYQHVMDQILACTQREKLLPELFTEESQVNNTSGSSKLKAVLVTSLHPEYSDVLKNMFWERPSSTGEIIEVYQPSGEKAQRTGTKLHDQKALAEIYLLSLTDELVTTTKSTFGYVAQGLGGLKPWILYKPTHNKVPEPPCVRDMSMDPCFHRPPQHGCQAKTIKITPFVRYCEDWKTGIKIVDV